MWAKRMLATSLLVGATIAGVVPGAASAATSPRVHGGLKFTSAAGDTVGGPVRAFKFRVTALSGGTTMTLRTLYSVDNSIVISVSEPGFTNYADLELASADGTPLAKGHYANATREGAPRSGQPGMFFDFDGRGCNQVFGDFTVNHIARAADGHIKSLDVTFSQHCEQADAPLLSGRVRYVEL